jgi:hypothetical protein
MHTSEMKKWGFIKNKFMERMVRASVEKATLIPFTHVSQPSFEIDGYWIVRNQCHANVEYKMKYPFIEYLGCTCDGHYEIFTNTKLLLFSWSLMLPKRMSLIMVEHGI